jgi:hypothetical protein
VPHFERPADLCPSTSGQGDSVLDDDEDAMDEAAQALREAEVEAVQSVKPTAEPSRLEDMSLDELRALAAKLDVPNRGTITEQDRLITAIRERMQTV